MCFAIQCPCNKSSPKSSRLDTANQNTITKLESHRLEHRLPRGPLAIGGGGGGVGAVGAGVGGGR